MLGRDSLTKLYVCIRSFFSVRWGCQILSLGHEKATESPQTKISNQEPLYSWFIQALIHPIFLYDTGILPCIFGPSWLRQYFNHRWQVFFFSKTQCRWKFIPQQQYLQIYLCCNVFNFVFGFLCVFHKRWIYECFGVHFCQHVAFFVRPFTLESGHF